MMMSNPDILNSVKNTNMLSFARATFLLGIQLLASHLPAARAAQYTRDEIEDIFDGLRNRNCTGFDLCNPEWTEETFDGWQKHHLFVLLNCQMNYDILDQRTVEIVKNNLNDMDIFNTMDRMELVYNVFDFSDDIVEAGKCGAHDASAPAPAESIESLCGSVGYYGKCHPDWNRSTLDEYTPFALKELIRCQVGMFEDILDDDDVDNVMAYLNNMNKGALERVALEFNEIANAEYCGGASADAPDSEYSWYDEYDGNEDAAPAPAESIESLCGSVGYYGDCHPKWDKSSIESYDTDALRILITCQVRKYEELLDQDDIDNVMATLDDLNRKKLKLKVLEFIDVANKEYCKPRPDEAPSSGYFTYSVIGGIAVASAAVGF